MDSTLKQILNTLTGAKTATDAYLSTATWTHTSEQIAGIAKGLQLAIGLVEARMAAEQASATSQSKNEFTKGYSCAVASFLKMHGEETYARDMYQCNFHTVAELQAFGVDEDDIETLKPIIADIERRDRMKRIGDDIHKQRTHKIS